MSVLLRTLMLVASIGAILVPAQASDLSGASRGSRGRPAVFAEAPAAPVRYTEVDREFYMDEEMIAYIRPGLTITINSITDVAPSKKPVVEVTFTDDFGAGLDRLGRTTPGTVSASFILAWFNPETRQYTSWTTRTVTTPANSPRPGVTTVQAGADSGGVVAEIVRRIAAAAGP